MKSIAKPRLIVLSGIIAAFVAALPVLVFPACGVESSAYLESVEQGGGSVTQIELTNKATVALPNSISINPSMFRYWSILYRIYVSGTTPSGQIPTTALSQINPYLATDYANFYSYTDITNNTIQNTNIHTMFSNNGYYEIALEGASISSALNTSNKNLVFEFPQPAGSIPTLSITDKNTGAVINKYNLLRSTGASGEDGINNKPNNRPQGGERYFRNSDDLNASMYNSKTTNDGNSWNSDVADNSSVTAPRYTYVSLYIIALGQDYAYNPISSRPIFVAILRLPEK